MFVHLGNLRICGAALVAALLVLVAGCSDDTSGTTAYVGSPATDTHSPEPDPLAGAPALEVCYAMSRSAADAVTNDGPEVACSQPHTSMTYHLGAFPPGADVSDPEVASRGCRQNLAEGVGLSAKKARSSILTYIWFEPSAEQWAAGARWYRCDVIAQSGDGPFKPLPQSTPFFPGGVPDEFFRCIRGGSEEGTQVTCDRAHGYRWAGSFEGTGDRRPRRAGLLAQAEKHCYDLTGTRSWWVTWPSADQWASGDREMDCFKQTRS